MGNGGSLPSILALHHGAVKAQERRRLERDRQGGDLHYMTVCSGGAISRVVLADVAGTAKSSAPLPIDCGMDFENKPGLSRFS
jgi:hypothetical protein